MRNEPNRRLGFPALTQKIAPVEEQQQAQQREFEEQAREKWSKKSEAARNKLEKALQEQLAQRQKELAAKLKKMPEWQERAQLKEKLTNCFWEKKCDPVLDVPVHLRDFAHKQVPQWVQSAMSALFLLKEQRKYTISNGKIVPIDAKNTGTLQQNMVWSDGLTQFLQIKEGLKVSPEGISTNYLSTISFFQRYGAALYGLTGTLGNETTTNFFRAVYGTDTVIIPPYQHRTIVGNEHSRYLCKELTAQILPTQKQWQQAICQSVITKAQQQQAVLVICEYIEYARALCQQIKKQYPASKVYTYTGTDTFDKEQVEPGDIILATNIAGRGTDLKTTKAVAAHGGLHVCITFLPESDRVERQNAGRTAREGQKGTAQLILHAPKQPTIEALRSQRQEQEDEAIAKATQSVAQILLKDQLFSRYCALDQALLPSQAESQKQAQYQLLQRAWERCRQQALTPTRLQSLYRQALDAAATTQLQASSPSSTEEEKKVEEILQKTVLPQQITQQDFQQFTRHCEEQLFAQLCTIYQGAVAPDVLEAFRKHQPWGNPAALAQRYQWGEHERGALQERWGQGLKITEHQHQEATRAILNQWFDAFEQEIWSDAHNDQIVKNPCFYGRKGNELINKGYYSKAIAYFNRAIELDPKFSVFARYNKVRALLSEEHNRDNHTAALKELATINILLEAYYRSSLTSFNALTSQTGTKQKLSEHVQHQLDILSQVESYSHQAMAAIKDAQQQADGGWDVQLTQHALTEPFQNAPKGHKQALEEAQVNGLAHFFTVEKVQPKPSFWQYFALAMVGIAQAGVGVCLCCTGALHVAQSFISEGIQDFLAAIKKGFKGEGFTWAEWALQKVIAVTTAAVSWGLDQLKQGFKVLKDSVKEGIDQIKNIGTQLAGGWDGMKKDAIKTAMQRVGLTLGQEVGKEFVAEALNYTADKTLVSSIEKLIREKVTATVAEALNADPLVQRALALDVAQNTNYWQNTFLQIGQDLLHQDNSKLKQFIQGVAQGVFVKSHKNASACLATLKAQKTIVEPGFKTTDFMQEFKRKVQVRHQQQIERAQKTCQKQQEELEQLQKLAQREDELQQHIQQIATIPTDELTAQDIPTQVLGDPGTYCSELQAPLNTLRTHYAPPSTLSHLRDTFAAYITTQLTASVRQNMVHPLTSAAASYGIKRLTAPAERALQKLETDLLIKQAPSLEGKVLAQERLAEETQQQNQATQQALKGMKPEEQEAYVNQLCEAQNIPPEVRQKALAILHNKQGDIGDMGVLAQLLQCPIKIYRPDGQYHTTLGGSLPGKEIPLEYEAEHTHWKLRDDPTKLQASGPTNCLWDAAFAKWQQHASPQEQERLGLHSGQDLRTAIASTLLHNGRLAQQVVQATNTLAAYQPNEIWAGGSQQMEDYYMRTDPHCFGNRLLLSNNPVYKHLEQPEWKALQSGHQEEAAALAAQREALEVAAFHERQAQEQAYCRILGNMVIIGGVAYFTGGVGLTAYFTSRIAVTATSMALDPHLRAQCAAGDWPGAWATSQRHLPYWAPLRSGADAWARGAYVQAGLHAALLAVDVAGLRYAVNNPAGPRVPLGVRVGPGGILSNPTKFQQFASEIVEMNKKTEGMGCFFAGRDIKSILNSASYYSSIPEQGAAIFRGIIKNHAFVNGNHRTAVNAFKRFAQQHNIVLNLSDKQLFSIAKQVESNSLVDVGQIASELVK